MKNVKIENYHLTMKNFIVILLLFTNLLLGIKPLYSQNFSKLNIIEKQLEDVSLSENYSNKTKKFIATVKKLSLPVAIMFPTLTKNMGNYYKYTFTSKISKYGIHVLYCSYLN